jgi:hypothetical protein
MGAFPVDLSLSYGTLLTTTMFNYRGTFYDNVFNAIPVFVMLRNKKRIEQGGERIAIPLVYARNDTFASINGYDTVDTTPQDSLTTVFSNWKEFAGSISISRREENVNRGKAQIINMLTAKTQVAEMSAAEGLAVQVLGNVATTDPTLDLSPISYLVQNDPTASKDVQELDQSVYSAWRNQYRDATAGSDTTFAAFLKGMENLYNTCSKGGGAGKRSTPNWICCDQGYYETYIAACRDKTRIVKYDETIANLGFGGAKFRNATLTWDEYVPDTETGTDVTSATVDTYTRTYYTAFFLNTEFLEYVVMAGSDLDVGPFIKPENQVARTAIVYNMANLVCSNRRKQGVHFKVPTSITS